MGSRRQVTRSRAGPGEVPTFGSTQPNPGGSEQLLSGLLMVRVRAWLLARLPFPASAKTPFPSWDRRTPVLFSHVWAQLHGCAFCRLSPRLPQPLTGLSAELTRVSSRALKPSLLHLTSLASTSHRAQPSSLLPPGYPSTPQFVFISPFIHLLHLHHHHLRRAYPAFPSPSSLSSRRLW